MVGDGTMIDPRSLPDWLNAFGAGAAAGSVLSSAAPIAGIKSFFQTAYHNRGDGLPKALSSAYNASRGTIRGAIDLSGWMMDYTSQMFPDRNAFRNAGFAVGAVAPYLGIIGGGYYGLRAWRAGNRNRALAYLGLGLTFSAMSFHDALKSMDQFQKVMNLNKRLSGNPSSP